jgi:V8-like Glu-specific endopeptidase
MRTFDARTFGIAVALAALLTACGGGSSGSPPSTSPTPAPTTPGINACAAIAGTSSIISADIVTGTDCSTAASAVVKINMNDATKLPLGSCSGTIIGTRSVLTAAHCLVNGVAGVQIYLGVEDGTLRTASSFAAYPGYHEGDPNGLDVGVVTFAADIGRAALPVLLSRDARVGETSVIAGWGNDLNQNAATLRAGTASITAVGSNFLQTQFTTTASGVCQGDSGGPLLLQEGGAWAVAGIISANTTTACSSGANFYANVRNSQISSFIRANVPDAATR